jgi:hypothetical protein
MPSRVPDLRVLNAARRRQPAASGFIRSAPSALAELPHQAFAGGAGVLLVDHSQEQGYRLENYMTMSDH